MSGADGEAVARWRRHPLCRADVPWPARYWGPERLDPTAWRELAARLDPTAELTALIAALAGARDVIDVGGGTGLLTRARVERVGPVVVVEPSDEQRAHAPSIDGLTVIAGRAEEVPLPDGAADAAVATWVLQYTDEPDRAVAELARVARRHVAIVQAAPANELVVAYNRAAATVGLPPAHHGFLLAQAAAQLERAGFTVELAAVPVAVAIDGADLARDLHALTDTLMRLHFAEHPAREAMRAAVEPWVRASATRGFLVDDGVLLTARR